MLEPDDVKVSSPVLMGVRGSDAPILPSQAQENYPMWVAAIAGQMGDKTDSGFVLKEPNVQTFEKKPKEPKEEAAPVISAAS